MSAEPLVFTTRPDGTALWLSTSVAQAIKAKPRERLTEAQMNHPEVLAYIRAHTAQKAK